VDGIINNETVEEESPLHECRSLGEILDMDIFEKWTGTFLLQGLDHPFNKHFKDKYLLN